MSEESGWVIERSDSSPSEPKYWAANVGDPARFSAWTSNHMEAIRFARKDDAEKVWKRMMPSIDVRICEHGWDSAAAEKYSHHVQTFNSGESNNCEQDEGA